MDSAIKTRGLRKVYKAPKPSRVGGRSVFPTPASAPPRATGLHGGQIVALAGLDLEVERGELFGLLGPNGAGKTTTIGILTTRLKPTAGQAWVAGADVVKDEAGVKQRIGVVPQRPNPDRSLRAKENLVFHASYFGIPGSVADRRANELLEALELGDRAESKIDELSGGQQQRLMIARALIHDPEVLFLDEPTVGLDPQARHALWDVMRDLHGQGRTIILTTHYMEEADQLCGRIAIVDRGKLLAMDTPTKLKQRAPEGTLVELTLDGDARIARDAVRTVPTVTRTEAEGQTLRVYAPRGGEVLPALIKACEQTGYPVHDIHLSPPSLETLFISLTGRKLD